MTEKLPSAAPGTTPPTKLPGAGSGVRVVALPVLFATMVAAADGGIKWLSGAWSMYSAKRMLGPSERLKRLLRLQRLSAIACFAAIVLVFGGFLVGIVQGAVGGYMMLFGWWLAGLDLLYSYVVLPFLKCPRCAGRFFTANGAWSLIARIDVLNRRCVHCGLTEDSPPN